MILFWEDKPYEFPDDKKIIIGRSEECDLKIKNYTLSKQHCCIYKEGEKYKIKDLESKNGVYVNGRKIEEGILEEGDRIKLGDVILYFGKVKEEEFLLEVVSGKCEGARFYLKRAPVRIGRANADFILNDPSVSSVHALIEYNNGKYILRDSGSTNGIWVEGKRIDSLELNDNTVFRIGDNTIFFGTLESLENFRTKKSSVLKELLLNKFSLILGGISILIILIIVFLVVHNKKYLEERGNILSNPSFEKWTDSFPLDWKVDVPGAKVEKTTGSYDGRYALHVVSSVNNTEGKILGKVVKLDKGGYLLKCYIKGNIKEGIIGLGLESKNKSYLIDFTTGEIFDWQKLEGNFYIERNKEFTPFIFCKNFLGKASLDLFIMKRATEEDTKKSFTLFDEDVGIKVRRFQYTIFRDKQEVFSCKLGVIHENKVYDMEEWGTIEKVLTTGTICKIEGKIYFPFNNQVKKYKEIITKKDNKISVEMKGITQDIALVLTPNVVLHGFTLHKEFLIDTSSNSKNLKEILVNNKNKNIVIGTNLSTGIDVEMKNRTYVITKGGLSLSFYPYSEYIKAKLSSLLKDARDNLDKEEYKLCYASLQKIYRYHEYKNYIKDAESIERDLKDKVGTILNTLIIKSKSIRTFREYNKFKDEIWGRYASKFKGTPFYSKFEEIINNTQNRILNALRQKRYKEYIKIYNKMKEMLKKEKFSISKVLLENIYQKYPEFLDSKKYNELKEEIRKKEEMVAAREDYIKKKYKEAKNYLMNNMPQKAIEIYKKILLRFPNHKETQRRLKQLEENLK